MTATVPTLEERLDALTVDEDLKGFLRDMIRGPSVQGQVPVDPDFPTPNWMEQEVYTADYDRWAITVPNPAGGVYGGTHFEVRQRAAGPNYSVDISPGYADVPGTDRPLQGSYRCRLLSTKNRAPTAVPAAGLQRIDLVCAQVWDQAVIGSTAQPPWNVVIVKGAETAAAVAPAAPASAIPLAEIGPILPNTVQITNAMIKDRRALAPTTVMLAEVVLAADAASFGQIRIPQIGRSLRVRAGQLLSSVQCNMAWRANGDATAAYEYIYITAGTMEPLSRFGAFNVLFGLAGGIGLLGGATPRGAMDGVMPDYRGSSAKMLLTGSCFYAQAGAGNNPPVQWRSDRTAGFFNGAAPITSIEFLLDIGGAVYKAGSWLQIWIDR